MRLHQVNRTNEHPAKYGMMSSSLSKKTESANLANVVSCLYIDNNLKNGYPRISSQLPRETDTNAQPMATAFLQRITATTQLPFPRPKISDPENYVDIVIPSAVEEAQREYIPLYNVKYTEISI